MWYVRYGRDLRYIPSAWHHAVLTLPDESCTALSVNLWYRRQAKATATCER